MNPLILAVLYFLVGNLFVMFAIVHVQTEGWEFFSVLFIGIAAADYMLAWHNLQKRKQSQSNQ
ncbi:hypothetical protein JCM19037_3590 [Geomicrobium sp. JCM 19037]|uniref:DUF4305 domain-containing protein n=1 Tax=Geomicrobium sp. JCM 19037 TaxID=1460634 RepID=UPI00045F1DAB|nr:DUF4305 domain-containing protein [Geomicrobium sp. JCM 19037]GAK05119.1 hypothetical protein JCM19037_3590 [Geomicrobium sp. JCM 19037]